MFSDFAGILSQTSNLSEISTKAHTRDDKIKVITVQWSDKLIALECTSNVHTAVQLFPRRRVTELFASWSWGTAEHGGQPMSVLRTAWVLRCSRLQPECLTAEPCTGTALNSHTYHRFNGHFAMWTCHPAFERGAFAWRFFFCLPTTRISAAPDFNFLH